MNNKLFDMQTVIVFSVGELSAPPDVCDLKIFVKSSKPDVKSAEESSKKRTDYILQVARNHKIARKFVSQSRSLERSKDEYILLTELLIKINGEVGIWQDIRNTIVEKLDRVTVCDPVWYHSDDLLHKLRQNAFTKALKQCKEKAQDIAITLGTKVGGVISVEEKENHEWRGVAKLRPTNGKSSNEGEESVHSMHGDFESANWNVSTRVMVVFQLQDL